jgi:hypothetical protein
MQLSSLEDGDILFLDELLEADQFVLSTLLTVIESREMADGTPLPDIQIIAATNDTIPPEQLKGNIRQRFMFQRFRVDDLQTGEYIKKLTGMDIPVTVLSKLTDKGGDYNFLTPRSLTKLCMWIDAAKTEEQAKSVAHVINDIWGSTIGGEILLARQRRDAKVDTPEQQVRKAVTRMVEESQLAGDGIFEDIPEDFSFDDCTMEEMLTMLQGLPEWEQIAKQLSEIEIEEQEEKEDIVL